MSGKVYISYVNSWQVLERMVIAPLERKNRCKMPAAMEQEASAGSSIVPSQ